MEPLAALGLASAVAQFLDFGAKVFQASKHITDDGPTVSNAQLQALAVDLSQVTGILVTQI